MQVWRKEKRRSGKKIACSKISQIKIDTQWFDEIVIYHANCF